MSFRGLSFQNWALSFLLDCQGPIHICSNCIVCAHFGQQDKIYTRKFRLIPRGFYTGFQREQFHIGKCI